MRPEDLVIVPAEQGVLTGTVDSVLFKGMHYETIVETVPGTSVTVRMRIVKNNEVISADGKEKISANDFFVDIDDVKLLDDKEIVARADAQAWNPETDDYISISNIEYSVAEEEGEYPVVFSTKSGTMIQKMIYVVDQSIVKNVKANEAVMAFNFFKTADELMESQALDTDLKLWANAQGWKLSDENESVEMYADYDFDLDNIREGMSYRVTFSTTGRELKVRTVNYVEEGTEVGLKFGKNDIHVMKRMM